MRRQAIKAGASGRPMPKWLARQRRLRDRLSLTSAGIKALRRKIAAAYRGTDAKLVAFDDHEMEFVDSQPLPTADELRRLDLARQYVRQFGDLPGETDDIIEETLRLVGATS